jgi:RsiW-degrading membrane proteinase PrsW (M82 family)
MVLTLIQSQSDPVLGILLIAVSLALYFIPTFIAVKRKHPNSVAIVTVNLLLGWTVIGWIVALVWSVTYRRFCL